ncbi:MAG: tetratricopeptide repeat protein, partial [Chloroflexota bacterium]
AGIKEANRLLTFDPYDETVQRDLMALYWRSGHRNGALQQYASLKKLLNEELGVQPMRETTKLYDLIRTAPAAARHNLPLETSPFIGRTAHLAQLAQTVAKPACRLQSIVGPGGVGKTRLLLEFGRQILARYPGQFSDGVCYFRLAQLTNGRFLATSMAETLGISLSNSAEPIVDVQNYLRGKELLLLLDNFEHLLGEDEGAEQALACVTGIIQHAPHVKIIVSSRERLRLQEEWVYSLPGLSAPSDDWESQLSDQTLSHLTQTYEAIELFAQSAGRIDSDFAVTQENIRPIGAVCRLLEGLPLGIELAAAWVRGMTTADIYRRLDANFDFLVTDLRNKPQSHQTLRKLFDQTWEMLPEAESRIMRHLSVFRGHFSAEAAHAVADADLKTLMRLVDKSLLRVVKTEASLQFTLHELIRRYAAEQLAADAPLESDVRTSHAHYYARFVQARTTQLMNFGPKAVVQDVADGIDEIRHAWEWSQTSGDEKIVSESLIGLLHFYIHKGWWHEGLMLAKGQKETLLKRGSGNNLLLLQLDMWEAETYCWMSRLEESQALFIKVIEKAVQEDAIHEYNFSINALGRIKNGTGDYDEAIAFFEESLALSRRLNDGLMVSLNLNGLAFAYAERDRDYAKAEDLWQESLEVSQAIDDKNGCARALINMGSIGFYDRRLAKAKARCQEAYEIYTEIGNPYGVGAALKFLSHIVFLQEDYRLAKRYIEDSHALSKDAGNPRGVFECVLQLGNIARNQKDFETARAHYDDALQQAVEMNFEKLGLYLFLELAEYCQMSGQTAEALKLVNFILTYPRSGKEIVASTKGLIERKSLVMPDDETLLTDEERTYAGILSFAQQIIR